MGDRIDNTRDKVEGKADELAGRGKQAFGDLTGDERTRSEGASQEMSGKAQGFMGELKNKVLDIKKKLTK